MKVFIFIFLKFYQNFINPFLVSSCRFNPTCSIYIYNVLIKYNFFFAFFLIFFRLIRCNKFFVGGYNPV